LIRPSITVIIFSSPRWQHFECLRTYYVHTTVSFLCATAHSAKRILAIVILSVCPSVCHNPVPNQAKVR